LGTVTAIRPVDLRCSIAKAIVSVIPVTPEEEDRLCRAVQAAIAPRDRRRRAEAVPAISDSRDAEWRAILNRLDRLAAAAAVSASAAWSTSNEFHGSGERSRNAIASLPQMLDYIHEEVKELRELIESRAPGEAQP
jgi:hypothetical protein